jgi:AcrR family transcriptional regulator
MAVDMSRRHVLAVARRLGADGRQPTMDELADSAGVAVRTLYRMFGSRRALLSEAGLSQELSARQRILDAALDQVGQHGLANLSMDDLAAIARVSRATVYRLFPGKSALFDALIREFSPWDPVADVIDAMPDGRPEEVMPAIAHAVGEAVRGRVGLLLRMVFELTQGNPDTAEAMRHTMARGLPDLVGYLSRQMEAGRLRRMHPILAFQLLAGPIVVHQLTRPLAEPLIGFSESPSELLDEIVQAWLRAMAPDSQSPTA